MEYTLSGEHLFIDAQIKMVSAKFLESKLINRMIYIPNQVHSSP